MPKKDDFILRLLENALDEAVPLKRLVQLVRETYREAEAPSKATIWRAVNRLVAQGLVNIESRKIIHEYVQHYLSPVKLPNIDELLSPK